MAKDRDKNSEHDQIEEEECDEFEDDEEDLVVPDEHRCPRFGWHNTRPSYSKTILDSIFRTFALYPYRCRTCGNRFRVSRRAPHE